MVPLRTPSMETAVSWAALRAVALFLLLATALSYGATVAPRLPVPPAPVPEHTVATSSTGLPLWETRYAERFPGCVSTLLWPVSEVPAALLTRELDGDVTRVGLDEHVGSAVETIGVCR